jgi:hypothetical protein
VDGSAQGRNGTQPVGIQEIDRVVVDVGIEVDPVAEGVCAQIPSGVRIIVPIPVVMQPSLCVCVLARQYSDAGAL